MTQQKPSRAVDMTGVGSASVTRLSDAVSEQIRQFIVREDLPEGSRLPSERDLAIRFDTSRPTVSQALRTLSLMGMVEIRRGSGAYVLRRPATMVAASMSLMLAEDHKSIHDLMQLRLWLETIGVQEAARRAPPVTKKELTTIRAALRRLADAAGNTSAWIAADTVFHAAIVGAARNPYLTAMYESVHTSILSFEYEHWVKTQAEPDWLREAGGEDLLALHEPILEAVVMRDVVAVEEAVLRHHETMHRHVDARLRSEARGRRRVRK